MLFGFVTTRVNSEKPSNTFCPFIIFGELLPHILFRIPKISACNRKSTMLLDKDGRCFAFRTTQIPFLMAAQAEFREAVHKLLERDLESPVIAREHALGIRGPHLPCIMGHHRQYTKVRRPVFL